MSNQEFLSSTLPLERITRLQAFHLSVILSRIWHVSSSTHFSTCEPFFSVLTATESEIPYSLFMHEGWLFTSHLCGERWSLARGGGSFTAGVMRKKAKENITKKEAGRERKRCMAASVGNTLSCIKLQIQRHPGMCTF